MANSIFDPNELIEKAKEVYAEQAVKYGAEDTVEREMGDNKQVLEMPTVGASGEGRWDGARLDRDPVQKDAITLKFGDYECQADLMAEMYPGTDKEVKTYSYQDKDGKQMMYCQSPYLGDFSYDGNQFGIGYKELPDGQLPIFKYVGDVQADWQHSGKSPAAMVGDRPVDEIGQAFGSNLAVLGNKAINGLDFLGIIPDDPIATGDGYTRNEQVKIPEGVKRLDYTFEGNDQIQLVPGIPASVESMHCAFKDCSQLHDLSAQFTQSDRWEIPPTVKDATYAFTGCTELRNHGFTISATDRNENMGKFEGMASGCPHFEDKSLIDSVSIGLQAIGLGGGRKDTSLDESLFRPRDESRGTRFSQFVAVQSEANPEFKEKLDKAIADRINDGTSVAAQLDTGNPNPAQPGMGLFGLAAGGTLAQRIADFFKDNSEKPIIKEQFTKPIEGADKPNLIPEDGSDFVNPYDSVAASKIALFTVEPAMSFRSVDNKEAEDALMKQLRDNSSECCEAGVFARIADNGPETYNTVKDSMASALAAKEGYFELCMAPNSEGGMDPEEAKAGMRQYYGDLLKGLESYSDGAMASIEYAETHRDELKGIIPDLNKSREGLAYVNCGYGAAVMDSLKRMDDKYHFMEMEDWMELDNTKAYGVTGLSEFKAGDNLTPTTTQMGYTVEELDKMNKAEDIPEYDNVAAAAGLAGVDIFKIFKQGEKQETQEETAQAEQNAVQTVLNKAGAGLEAGLEAGKEAVQKGLEVVQEAARPVLDGLKSVGETLISPFTTMFKSPEDQLKEDASKENIQKPAKDYGKMAEDQLLSDELKQSLNDLHKEDQVEDGLGR